MPNGLHEVRGFHGGSTKSWNFSIPDPANRANQTKILGRSLPRALSASRAIPERRSRDGANEERGLYVTRYFLSSVDLSRPSECMRQAIDSLRGWKLYLQRIGTMEPVFANLRHSKRMNHLNFCG